MRNAVTLRTQLRQQKKNTKKHHGSVHKMTLRTLRILERARCSRQTYTVKMHIALTASRIQSALLVRTP
jgi:hypothetical protein